MHKTTRVKSTSLGNSLLGLEKETLEGTSDFVQVGC